MVSDCGSVCVVLVLSGTTKPSGLNHTVKITINRDSAYARSFGHVNIIGMKTISFDQARVNLYTYRI